MAKRKLEGSLELEDNTQAGVQSATKGMKTLGETAKDTNQKIEKSSKDASAGLAKMAKTVIGGVIAWKAISGAVGKFIQIQRENVALSAIQTKAENAIALALRNTNQGSEEVFESLKRQASAIQAVTTVGDEFLLQQQATLLSLGATTGQLDEVSRVALDMGAALQKGPGFGFKILQQAVQGNFETLKRYSVKAAEVGTETGDLSKVLEVLRGQFGGMAEEEAKTLTGRMEQIKNAFGDYKEVTGSIIETSPELIAVLGVVVEIIGKLGEKAKDNTGAMQDFVKKGLRFFVFGADITIRSIGFIIQNLNLMRLGFVTVKTTILAASESIVKGLQFIVQGYVEIINLFKKSENEISNPLDGIVETIQNMGDESLEGFGKVADSMVEVNATTNQLRGIIADLDDAILTAVPSALDLGDALGPTDKTGSLAAGAKDAADELGRLSDEAIEAIRAMLPARSFLKDFGDTTLGGTIVTGAFQAKAALGDFVNSAVNAGELISNAMGAIAQSIFELVTFNKEAALEFVDDQTRAARSAELAHLDSIDAVKRARQELLDAQRAGDSVALSLAQRNLEKVVLAEEVANARRGESAQELADLKIDAELGASRSVLQIITKLMNDIVQQVISAAIAQLTAQLAVAEASVLGQEISKGGIVGIITGLAAAGAIAGIFAGLIGRAKNAGSAAEGGIINSGSGRGDDVPILAGRDEVILNPRQQRIAFGQILQPSGTTSGGLGRIREDDLRGGGVTIGNLELHAHGMQDPEAFARQAATFLRREIARGGF